MRPKIPSLEGARCYLSGPIECGDGPNWRTNVTKVLTDEFKIELFDPFNDPKQQKTRLLERAREQKNYKAIRRIVKKFVRKDLGVVDRSDFIISYLPHKVPTCGTHHEIIESNARKKPTLLICPEGKEYLPYWYFGFIPDRFMFGSWEDLYVYLRQVNEGAHTRDNRWFFVYRLI